MDLERINLIVKNLELLITSLKEELNNVTPSEISYDDEVITRAEIDDYDEVFYDDEDDTDWRRMV